MRRRTWSALVLMVVLPALNGCLWHTRKVPQARMPANVLSAALYARFRSRDDHGFADRLLSAMRKGFGGHIEAKGS